MSMYMLNCPTCLVEKPESCKHVRKIEVDSGSAEKFFTCQQCHKDYAVLDDDPKHFVVGPELERV
ncbi:hypothetical protein PQO03_10320 [Lentisphaera profundi]|uniref:Uncharacterized protein n=1 Tax=Lentisphaera profundi TaxID=1658616 RepID=A0ABY7VPL9_9BACT|nr:hypothetical protein [Lentisphaera profundi]WDE96108.1 hypothetical protein PQO03_10320 [Lentisphaera profundi]